jgi:hypothetical protein
MYTCIHHYNKILHVVFHSSECMICQCLKVRIDESNIPFQESRDMLHCPTRSYAGSDTMTHANESEASIHVEVW